MSLIKTLSPSLVAKIAAGEVIERPSYVVKELVENSLDAGATTITIKMSGFGLKGIVVTDNGCGMDDEDLQLCFLKNTTSKIFQDTDLYKIHTFGFRGEALASLATVSSLIIQSKIASQNHGNVLSYFDGQVSDMSHVGCPDGTTVIVENLFSNLPVRKKFLTNHNSEVRQIIKVIQQFATIFHKIKFSLINEDKVVLDFPSQEKWIDRLTDIYGESYCQHLIPLSEKSDIFQISGFIGRPQIASHSSQYQFLYVNNRCVADPQIAHTIRLAYGKLLDKTSFPFSLINLKLPPELIDVNIHPRKETILFHDSIYVNKFVSKVVGETIRSHDMSYQQEDGFVPQNRKTDAPLHQFLKKVTPLWQLKTFSEDSLDEILQVHNLYIIAPTDNGVVMIDQHAAHERILYEEFKQKFLEQKTLAKPFPLEKPFVIELTSVQSFIFEKALEHFTTLGFDIENFAQNTFKINAVPEIYSNRNAKKIILEVLDDLYSGKTPAEVDSSTEKTLAFLACRTAIKAGEPLRKEQCQDLLRKLFSLPNDVAATCPHGRPTQVELTFNYLEKMFKRK